MNKINATLKTPAKTWDFTAFSYGEEARGARVSERVSVNVLSNL